jgi:hypothetical protein
MIEQTTKPWRPKTLVLLALLKMAIEFESTAQVASLCAQLRALATVVEARGLADVANSVEVRCDRGEYRRALAILDDLLPEAEATPCVSARRAPSPMPARIGPETVLGRTRDERARDTGEILPMRAGGSS